MRCFPVCPVGDPNKTDHIHAESKIEAAYLYLKGHPLGRTLVVSEEIIPLEAILASHPELNEAITIDEKSFQADSSNAAGQGSNEHVIAAKMGGPLLIFAYACLFNMLSVLWYKYLYTTANDGSIINPHYDDGFINDGVTIHCILLMLALIIKPLYGQQKKAPLLVSFVLLIQAVVMPFHVLIVGETRLLSELDPGTLLEMAIYPAWALIWIPYLLFSKRSRETFVN